MTNPITISHTPSGPSPVVVKAMSYSGEISDQMRQWIDDCLVEVNEMIIHHPTWEEQPPWQDKIGVFINFGKGSPEDDGIEGPTTVAYCRQLSWDVLSLGALPSSAEINFLFDQHPTLYEDEVETKEVIIHELFHAIFFNGHTFAVKGLLNDYKGYKWFTGPKAQEEFNRLYPTRPEWHNIGVPLAQTGGHLAESDSYYGGCLCVPGFPASNNRQPIMRPYVHSGFDGVIKLTLEIARDLGFEVNFSHPRVNHEYNIPTSAGFPEWSGCRESFNAGYPWATLEYLDMVDDNPTECYGWPRGINYLESPPQTHSADLNIHVESNQRFPPDHPYAQVGIPKLWWEDSDTIDNRIQVIKPEPPITNPILLEWVEVNKHPFATETAGQTPCWKTQTNLSGSYTFASNQGPPHNYKSTIRYKVDDGFNWHFKYETETHLYAEVRDGKAPVTCKPCDECLEFGDMVATGTRINHACMTGVPWTIPELTVDVKITPTQVCRHESTHGCDGYVELELFRKDDDPTLDYVNDKILENMTVVVSFQEGELCKEFSPEFPRISGNPNSMGRKGLGVNVRSVKSV